MKTTIDIAEPLLAEAKQVAAREGITLRELVEEGLRSVLTGRRRRRQTRLRDASFKGQGVQAGVHEGDWETIRDMIYQRQGS